MNIREAALAAHEQRERERELAHSEEQAMLLVRAEAARIVSKNRLAAVLEAIGVPIDGLLFGPRDRDMYSYNVEAVDGTGLIITANGEDAITVSVPCAVQGCSYHVYLHCVRSLANIGAWLAGEPRCDIHYTTTTTT